MATPLALHEQYAAVERTVRQDWEQNGRAYINKKCFDDCWHRIWEWLHLPTLKDHLKKHRVLTTPDDLDLITNSLRGPKERADSIVQRIVPKAGRFGYYLLYMCIRDDVTGNLLGHKDAVKELEAYAKLHMIKAPWEEDDGRTEATTAPHDAEYTTPSNTTHSPPSSVSGGAESSPPVAGQVFSKQALTGISTQYSAQMSMRRKQVKSDDVSPTQNQHRRGLLQSPESPEGGAVAIQQLPKVFVSSQEESGAQVPEAASRIVHGREQIRNPVVEYQTKEKEKKFRKLVRRTYQHLTKVIEDLDDFKVFVTLLPKQLGTRFEGEDLKLIQVAKCLADIFTVLNQYWNFTSYDLLEAVVEEYGDGHHKLQDEMKQYREEMEVFETATSLGPLVGLQLCNPRPNSCPVVAHLAGECSQKTLADVQLCRRCIAQEFGCDKTAIRWSKVDVGSVIVTFLVPSSIAGAMIIKARSRQLQHVLRQQWVLRLSIGGVRVYGSEGAQLKQLKATREEKELKIQLNKAKQDLKDNQRLTEKREIQIARLRLELASSREAHYYNLDAQTLLHDNENLQVEIGNILERTKGDVRYWDLVIQEAELAVHVDLDTISQLTPEEKLMSMLEQRAKAGAPVTVLAFCKACWKAGAHRAAEALEDAAKAETSLSSLWDESLMELSSYEVEFDQLTRSSASKSI